jgi:hypothetical protein
MSATRFLALVLAVSALVATALMAIPFDGAEGTGHTASIRDAAPYRLTSSVPATPPAAAQDTEAAIPRLSLGGAMAR